MGAIDGSAGEKVIASLAAIAPDLGRFIIEFAFGDIYTRQALDLHTRELVTVAALAAMGNARPQLKVHTHGFLNVGGSREELVELVIHTAPYAGFPRAINAALAVQEVLAERKGGVH
ncbi:carboxymuconolactone decarboxylase family protein [Ideonella azotifigens]|uniref:Carboxymuconolactone decarboxylase family protein n=1 Tax=Ideonella azotifigens TaxID=513160 RepID=A0ABP3VWY4_9BURK|nr:carboxymuconolactone decarboxylase family protein [Ideonella azotifigens]MCD2339526.1 carboxymuconolactone decarboxylase family protein [Ideonella azotifigens]